MKNPKVIIVGTGAAGISAASRLLENGINNITILEAQNRIGGRINSVEFGGGVIDMGAQWCHGQKGNVVYELAKNLDLLSHSEYSYDKFLFYETPGKVIPRYVTDQLLQLAHEIEEDRAVLEKTEGSLGEYFEKRYNETVKEMFDGNERYLKIAEQFLEWIQKFVICLNASPTWYDLSAKGITKYKECSGDYYLHWKNNGYISILNVLMKKIPDPKNKLPIDDKIFLNKEVTKIVWKGNNEGEVVVECLDGSSYSADHVIITVSLGVLKEKYASLFSPELPVKKQNAIVGIGFGAVVKIFLEFDHQWWPDDFEGFSFIWSEKDKEDLFSEFPCESCTHGRHWLEDVCGIYPIDSNFSRVLLVWVVGTQITLIESLPPEVISNGCMLLLRKFSGPEYNVTEPKNVLCSSWRTDPNFYGAYSYQSNEIVEKKVSVNDLAEPVVVEGKEVLLFSGEATHSCYYSTVHGAIESGFREADRIINMYKDPKAMKRRVVIVGAGMAGLGAAQTLVEAGCENVIILEAQDKAGGRIETESLYEESIDVGAQWIHGTDNAVYKLAEKCNLLSSLKSEEGLGIYVRNDGFVFNQFLVDKVDFEVGKILSQCEKFAACAHYPPSVGHFLDDKISEYLKTNNNNNEEILELMDWHERFQVIDNSCKDLKDLSAKDWGDYICLGEDGQAHINLKSGYKSVIDILVSRLPEGILKFRTPVSKIEWRVGTGNNVRITCSDQFTILADHVIFTASLGVLKHCASTIFQPALPNSHRDCIEHIGFYGGIGKIFLIFEKRWWKTEGIQLVWKKDAQVSGPESWTRHISGFDLVLNQPNALLGWVGGEGVAVMENLPEKDAGIHCVHLLRSFLKSDDIPYPIKVIRSKFASCPWIRGGYSYTTPQCDRFGIRRSNLSEPVYDEGIPRVLLAGEACHLHHFSTTHGAFESGQQQAKVLLDFMK